MNRSSSIRIGQGLDAHRFSDDPNRPLFLGGVEISGCKGLQGHSDADVLLHAICDALLGAAALGDIGLHFPPSDSSIEGIDSKKILHYTNGLLQQNGYVVVNIDATLVCEKPKIRPRVEDMRACISNILGCEQDQISIKGTTTEKMGFTGRGEGIFANCIALIEKVGGG